MTGIKMNWDGHLNHVLAFGCKECVNVTRCKFGCKEFNDEEIELGVNTFLIKYRVDEDFSKTIQ